VVTVASGKSTLAQRLLQHKNTLCISEDTWLSTLYPNEITSLESFRLRTSHLEKALAPHIADLLSNEMNVILDFHANTKKRRAWMMEIIKKSGCDHILHILETSDDTCMERLRIRNASNQHAYQVNQKEFDQLTAYFQYPEKSEGFTIKIHNNA